MSTRKTPPPQDRTPQAALSEAGAHDLIGYQLAQATIVTDQVFEAVVGERLRPVEFTVLALVQGNPGVTARQLARALAVTPPNITVCIDRLAARDLVTRERGKQDARVQHLRLTAAGEALVTQASRELHEREREAIGTLSAAERAMLVELLHKVALARRREGPGAQA